MRRRICISMILATVIAATYGHDLRSTLDGLISRGNRAYELSQATRIKECADSVKSLISGGELDQNSLKDYTVSLYKLSGNYHYEKENFDSAAIYYTQARQIIDANPEVDFHGNDLLMMREVAQLYYRIANYPAALEAMRKADDMLEYNGPYLPGSDDWLITKLTYAMCLARCKEYEEASRIAREELDNALDRNSLAYAKAQRMYGKILLLSDADKGGALRAYKDYFRTQKEYAISHFGEMTDRERTEYWHTLQPFIADCYRLEEADPGFLYDVALFSKGLLLQLSSTSGAGKASKETLNTLLYHWSDIGKKLKPGEAAIEFIQYPGEGSDQMAALILSYTGTPRLVKLTSPEEVMKKYDRAISSTSQEGKDGMYGDPEFGQAIWTPDLLKALQGKRKIYFSPDGYLHRIAMEYLPQVEDRKLYRLTSTRRLMQSHTKLNSTDPMLLMGGINYDLDKTLQTTPTPHDNDPDAYTLFKGVRFPRLSEQSNETPMILAIRRNPADSLLTGTIASEPNFRNLAPDYSSILISTHGDFCGRSPIATDIKPIGTDNSMSENIIAFSGVNSRLAKSCFEASRNYDGLLSAKELSGLDLSQCKLITISACQSGLGEITHDGVFGIQRGLKNAGADMLLLSLWNVNSNATALLMQSMHTNLNKGISVYEAFQKAREDLRNERPAQEDPQIEYRFDPATMSEIAVAKERHETYTSPKYTDAFILIDAID